VSSYIDLLSEDHRRIRRALEGLIAEEENQIRSLRGALDEYTSALDRRVIRTMVFRSLFGPRQAETLAAETDTEEASKPVTHTTQELEKSMLILEAYREALQLIDSGAPLGDLAQLDMSVRMRAAELMADEPNGDDSAAFRPAPGR
jgi:hypothetical protein